MTGRQSRRLVGRRRHGPSRFQREPRPIHSRITPRSGRREPAGSHKRSGHTPAADSDGPIGPWLLGELLHRVGIRWHGSSRRDCLENLRTYMTPQSEERGVSAGGIINPEQNLGCSQQPTHRIDFSAHRDAGLIDGRCRGDHIRMRGNFTGVLIVETRVSRTGSDRAVSGNTDRCCLLADKIIFTAILLAAEIQAKLWS
jgi:hypothetical protein